MRAPCLQLALVLVLTTKWSTDLDAIFVISGIFVLRWQLINSLEVPIEKRNGLKSSHKNPSFPRVLDIDSNIMFSLRLRNPCNICLYIPSSSLHRRNSFQKKS